VNAAAAAPGANPLGRLLDDYGRFVEGLPCGGQAKHIRGRQARAFLARVVDLHDWMRRPTLERLTLVRRLDAWTFLSWCFATGRVVPDLELIAAKGKGGHFSLWVSMYPEDIAELRAAASSFKWNPEWLTRIVANAYPLVGLTRGVPLREITDADLDAVDADLAASMLLPRITKVHLSAQNHGLRALCYQLGLIPDAPVHPNARPRTPAQRAWAVPQPRIREVLARY
jgi:hypothetical protein